MAAASVLSNGDVSPSLKEGGSPGDFRVIFEARAGAMPVKVKEKYNSVISGMVRANRSNRIMEENYYLLQWLYRIRRAGCARGLRIGFLQPDFLWVIYRPMMCWAKNLIRTDGDIRVAVNLWCFNRAEALKRYGHISDWDVSSVTDMSDMFRAQQYSYQGTRYFAVNFFNDDISRWDVSNVTNMSYMFYDAQSFNQSVGDWDVSNVTNMSYMFYDAQSFNQAVGDWDVSNVTDMNRMFNNAPSFNQAIGDWDVSKVTGMSHMFSGAVSFDQDLTRWDVRSVSCSVCYLFYNAHAMQRDNKPLIGRQ